MSAVALPRQEHGIMACLLLALLSPSLVAPAVARGAATGCKIVNTSLAVTIEGLKPQISAKINGNDVKFTVDSGAFYSILSPASAAENHLTLKPAPFGLMGQGIGRSPQEPAVSSAVSTDTQAAAGVVEPPVQADQAGHADQPPLPPGDPAELSRVGMAAAGRRDFDTALADLNRAVELAPDNPDYLFQRGSVHWQNRQPDLAMADFNRAIELKPDHVPALMDRAEMRIAGKNIDGAKSDLDAVDKTAAQQADVRLELARAYERAGLLESSIAQYELWTTSHQVDSRFGGALVGLCVTRALLNEDLPKALRNCNDAFKLAAKGSPLAAGALGGRGLVRLRLGDTDKAIADFDDSLKLNPRSAWSLYARGIAKVRKSKTAEGEGDMAEAAKIAPHIADQFAKWGITP